MKGKRFAAYLAALLFLLRLLLPEAAERVGAALRAALTGGGWESVETLGRSVAQGAP